MHLHKIVHILLEHNKTKKYTLNKSTGMAWVVMAGYQIDRGLFFTITSSINFQVTLLALCDSHFLPQLN